MADFFMTNAGQKFLDADFPALVEAIEKHTEAVNKQTEALEKQTELVGKLLEKMDAKAE